MNSRYNIIFFVGPTAIGKSSVAIDLCRQVNGEIVSADSMQVYKELSVVSAKSSDEDLAAVKHHVIDVVSVEDEFDVVKFRSLAIEAIEDIQSRGKTPIVVGGSGLYVQVLLDGIFEGTPKDEALRQELLDVANEKGNEYLHNQLMEKDSKAAEKIHSNDLKRIIRALEVLEITKQPMSKIQKERDGLWGKTDIIYVGLNMNREKLYERINTRVDEMFETGLIDEIKALRDKALSLTASHLIGVREVLAYLNDEYDLDRAKYLMKLNTRHFAKRQLTWFRRDERIEWINLDDVDSNNEVVTEILRKSHHA